MPAQSNYIPAHDELTDNPKFIEFVDALAASDISIPAELIDYVAEGVLVRFWNWVLRLRRMGNLTGIHRRRIARGANWPFDPDILFDALVSSGFVDVVNSEITVHNWLLYGGKMELKRQRDREEKAEKRSRRKDVGATNGNVVATNANVATTNDIDKIREEKTLSLNYKGVNRGDGLERERGALLEDKERICPSCKGAKSAQFPTCSACKKTPSKPKLGESHRCSVCFDRFYVDDGTLIDHEGKWYCLKCSSEREGCE